MIERIELAEWPGEPLRGHLPFGGRGIEVTSRFLERDGRPIIPVSAEVHFSRLPRERWPSLLDSVVDAGVTVLATYVIWNHHERTGGDLRFDDRLDLRHFLELCAERGLLAFLRIGPWAHAEARNGGLPDWLLAKDLSPRSNDPAYLIEVERWYSAIAEQVRGLDLFAVQVENELYDDPEHLLTLKRMAERLGIHAPVWAGTAWGGAQLPVDELLPLYAGYSEAFWIAHDHGVDAASASNFVYSDERDEVGVGADSRDSSQEPSNLDPARYPYATCELGGGMVAAYHRRPFAAADDVAALALTKLGCGSVWQGYYMFCDGENPGPGLQEAHATGGRNDMPELDYDFHAPIGLFGERRESWYRLRLQHRALSAFGHVLAPMVSIFPDPATRGDAALRWAVRTDRAGGFLFVTNHAPHTTMLAHEAAFEISLPGGVTRFPIVTIPVGRYFCWPFALELAGARLNWATAQLVTETTWRGAPLLVFAATEGIAPAMSWDGPSHRVQVDHPGEFAQVTARDGSLFHTLLLSSADALYLNLADLSVDRPIVSPRRPLPIREVRGAEDAPGVVVGPLGRASVPTDWSSAAIFEVALPPGARLVTVEWVGDVARAYVAGRLIADRFYTGRDWTIDAQGAEVLELRVLPLREDAPIYLPPDASPEFGPSHQAAAVTSASIR